MSREDARLATLSKEYQAMYGRENDQGERGPSKATTRPVSSYLVPINHPDGWIFDNGEGSMTMVIYNSYAAEILMAENPSYRVRPFIFLKTEI